MDAAFVCALPVLTVDETVKIVVFHTMTYSPSMLI